MSIARPPRFFPLLLALAWLLMPDSAFTASVTLVTHGFNSDVEGWIIPMADRIPLHPAYPGTNFTCYQISVTRNAQSQIVASASFLGGAHPLLSDTGELFVKLDWSTLSGLFNGESTATIATSAANALLATNLIPELGGRPLAELPLHLVGHSRGSSVVTEMARVLGAQGVWVDHVTTLDPRPVPSLGDPTLRNYANTFFTDNCWQNMGDGLFVPNGQPVFGAYNRQLTTLGGGYSSSHSDVHLWYHGTIELTTPATDTGANITASERNTWWTALEARGTNTGFHFSRIVRGDRFSNVEPAGPGTGMIRDGINKLWDFGAGLGVNRDPLPANNGSWPNLIRFVRPLTNTVPAGGSFPVTLYHQSGASTAAVNEVRFFIDADTNPFNSNEIQLLVANLTGTGANSVHLASPILPLNSTNVIPGNYQVFARIQNGVRTRYMYASQSLTVTPSLQPPVLVPGALEGGEYHFTVHGFPGQTIVIDATTDFIGWTAIATSTLTGTTWEVIDPAARSFAERFYQARLAD